MKHKFFLAFIADRNPKIMNCAMTNHFMMRLSVRLSPGLSFLIYVCLLQVLPAHEFWIEHPGHQVPVGQVIPVRLLVGEGFSGESYPRNPSHCLSFESESGGVRRPIPGFPNQDPAGFFIARHPGFHIIRYTSRNSQVEMPAQEFNRYLAEEGHTRLLQVRIDAGEEDSDVLENFRRCAAACIQAGSTSPANSRMVSFNPESPPHPSMELELELQPIHESDQELWLAGSEFQGHLTENGRPCPGRLIKFFHEGTPGQPVMTKWSDDNGGFQVILDQPGTWMLSSVSITGKGQDYASVWTSLTFVVRPNKLTP